MLAVMGLVAPLALALASAVGDDGSDGRLEIVGNDVGLPRPVAPDGRLYGGVAIEPCALSDLWATNVVRVVEANGPTRAVRTGAFPRLYDTWTVDVDGVAEGASPVAGPIDRLWVDAGTTFGDELDDGGGQLVFGVSVADGVDERPADAPRDLLVVAIGRSDDGRFRFDWPCVDELDDELLAEADRLGLDPDERLVIDLLLE